MRVEEVNGPDLTRLKMHPVATLQAPVHVVALRVSRSDQTLLLIDGERNGEFHGHARHLNDSRTTLMITTPGEPSEDMP